MTLANGRSYLAIPGPSVMPDRVLRAMHRGAPNIYRGELIELTEGLFPDLKSIARTEHNAAIYISNGHGAWEAALANTLSRGDTVLVLATGRFCIGWGEVASRMGIKVETIDFGNTADIDLAQVREKLASDRDNTIKAVLSVQVDTSTSVRNDIAGLRSAMDDVGHPALLMVDCIACLAVDRFEMDAWGVDVMVTGSQKGLMTPPGLSFVFFNDKADVARETADCVTQYWDWRPRTSPEWYYQYFCGTAPTHHLYGLREALDMINEEGLDAVWKRHETLAKMVWAAVDTWAAGGPMVANIADQSKRSHAVTSIGLGSAKAEDLRMWLEQNTGVTLGIGLGQEPADAFFRIGHMGHVNAHMVLGVLGTIEAGLIALNVPFGEGALNAAAKVAAQA